MGKVGGYEWVGASGKKMLRGMILLIGKVGVLFLCYGCTLSFVMRTHSILSRSSQLGVGELGIFRERKLILVIILSLSPRSCIDR